MSNIIINYTPDGDHISIMHIDNHQDVKHLPRNNVVSTESIKSITLLTVEELQAVAKWLELNGDGLWELKNKQ